MADDIGIKSVEAGQEASELSKSQSQKIGNIRDNAPNALLALSAIDPDLGEHFINQLRTSLEQICDFMDNIAKAATDYYQKEPEEEAVATTVPTGGNNGNWPPGGNNGGGGGGSKKTTPDTIPDTTPNTEPQSDPVEINLKALEEMKLSDLLGWMIAVRELYSPSKGTFEEFLLNEKYAEDIKNIILKSPHTPESLVKSLKDLDAKEVEKIVYQIFMGGNPEIFNMTDENKGALYSYLEIVASGKGITVEQLLDDPKTLKETMSGLSDVVELVKGWEEQGPEEFQNQLGIFYRGAAGEEFPERDSLAISAYVDYLSAESGLDSVDLISDKSYAETLQAGAQEFGKTLSFFNSTSFFSDKTMKAVVGNALKNTKVVKNNTETTPTNTTYVKADASVNPDSVGIMTVDENFVSDTDFDNSTSTNTVTVDASDTTENMYNPTVMG